VLEHIIAEGRRRGYQRLSLETGAMTSYFGPAHGLYRKAGFRECAAFIGYKPDPNSLFFTREV
jgi:putative acetyltransferase